MGSERELLYTKQDVLTMWARPYGVQINIAYTKITEAIMKTGGKIAVSFSGGKDSAVMLFMTAAVWATMNPDKPLTVIFADTGNEYIGMKKYVTDYCAYVQMRFGTKINLVVARARDATYRDAIFNEGYPIASKKTAKMIRSIRAELKRKGLQYSDIKDKSYHELRDMGIADGCVLYLTGYTSAGKYVKTWLLPQMWRPLIYAPFETSEKCCEMLKKKPLSEVQERLDGLQPMIGEMACDGKGRLEAYMKTGCNIFDSNGIGISKPLGAVTEQSLLRFIYEMKMPIFKVYGDLTEECGAYKFTGEERTGCKLCMFGISRGESGLKRFQRLNNIEPQTVKWAFRDRSEKGLGYQEVIDYLNKHCMGKRRIWTPEENSGGGQLELWSCGG